MNRIFVSQYLFGFLVILIAFLNGNEASSCEAYVAEDTELNTILSNNVLQFGVNLFDGLGGGTNVLISPFSVLITLTMTDEAVAEVAFNHLKRPPPIHHSSHKSRVHSSFQQYLHSLCPNDKFSIANRIYLRSPFPLNRTFTRTLETFFSAGYEDVDFGNNPSGVTTYINQWVEQRTRNTIKDLTSLSPDEVQVLINAIYFNGKWETQFDSAHTALQTFKFANGQSTEVPTMFSKNYFNYVFNDCLSSQVLQLNCDGSRLAAFIILPERGANLTSVQRQLTSGSTHFMTNLSTQLVDVYLPKFKVSFKKVLNEAIGNFSIVTPTGTSKVKVEHQAFVVVDEVGLMSAAATAFTVDIHSVPLITLPAHPGRALPVRFPPLPPNIRFTVDRPCFYLICDITFKQILFIGKLDDPLM